MHWSKSYETGIKKIDEEHQMLIQLINELEDAMTSGKSKQTMGQVLKNLVEYVKCHFKDEEKVMEKIGYDELERHKVLHKDLVNQVAGILIDLKNGKVWTPQELIGFLQNWVLCHILEEDLKIGRFLGVI